MDTTNLPEFVKSARFWFSLVNLIVLLSPRWGITLTQEEIAGINLVLASVFQIAPPVNGYIVAQRYAYAARHTPMKLEE